MASYYYINIFNQLDVVYDVEILQLKTIIIKMKDFNFIELKIIFKNIFLITTIF